MLHTPNDVIRFIDLNGIDNWTVKLNNDTNSHVFKTKTDEPLEKAKARFLEVMDFSKGGRYIFEGSEGNGTRGKFREEFSNLQSQNAGQTMNTPAMGATPTPEDIDAKIAKAVSEALERDRFIREKEDLERQRKEFLTEKREFERSRNSAIGQIMERAAPFLERIMPTTQVAVAGMADRQPIPPHDESDAQIIEDMTPEQQAQAEAIDAQITDLLTRWAATDPEFVSLLDAIVNVSETDPGTYKMAKGYLKKFIG